ncbi:MAG: hemin receptor [Oscillochloris sp.]|nr:hemin receptor [Oscillochloris sp.]
MNQRQKEHIRRTFAQIEPIATVAATLFYGRLFEIDPDSKHLFRYDLGSPGMAQQGAKLMQMIAVAVAHLDNLDNVIPAIEALARRHTSYGVEARHYDTVGAALLWTLEQGLGRDFTLEVHDAWTTLYGTLAGAMKQAAYTPA